MARAERIRRIDRATLTTFVASADSRAIVGQRSEPLARRTELVNTADACRARIGRVRVLRADAGSLDARSMTAA